MFGNGNHCYLYLHHHWLNDEKLSSSAFYSLSPYMLYSSFIYWVLTIIWHLVLIININLFLYHVNCFLKISVQMSFHCLTGHFNFCHFLEICFLTTFHSYFLSFLGFRAFIFGGISSYVLMVEYLDGFRITNISFSWQLSFRMTTFSIILFYFLLATVIIAKISIMSRVI